tara:strand:+ start:206 stop:643 length:438 start_codon:yes stop_codon:yes gene_type:complete
MALDNNALTTSTPALSGPVTTQFDLAIKRAAHARAEQQHAQVMAIKAAYSATLMSCLNAKNAGLRTRLQPYMISTSFTTMMQDFHQMDAYAQQGIAAPTGALQPTVPALLPAPGMADIEARVTAMETVQLANNEILAKILDKVGD